MKYIKTYENLFSLFNSKSRDKRTSDETKVKEFLDLLHSDKVWVSQNIKSKLITFIINVNTEDGEEVYKMVLSDKYRFFKESPGVLYEFDIDQRKLKDLASKIRKKYHEIELRHNTLRLKSI